jgi:Sulfotransferase family
VAGPLVHIGYHKTGTSWLQRYLFRNADIGFNSSGKGHGTPVTSLVAMRAIDFDAERARAEFEPVLEAARRRKLVPVVSLERLAGHPFSGGYDNKELAERLAAVMPDARILCVFREQTGMIASTYKQFVKTGGPSSVERFLHPPVHRHLRIPQFDLRHFEYDRLLLLYRTLFGSENVLFLPYEWFASDPRTFVEGIVTFAGTEAPPAAISDLPFEQRPNLAQAAVSTAIVRRLNRVLALADVNPNPLIAADPRLVKRLRRDVAAAVELFPRTVLDRGERRLRERISRIVHDRYAASNRRLSQLTGADLEPFGYVVEAAVRDDEAGQAE